MSESSSPVDEHDNHADLSRSDERVTSEGRKRKASVAGLDNTAGTAQVRSVKRRASKACQCCRARKVRCNVTEHGAPCTNCRLDDVECVVSESRRKKKWNNDDDASAVAASNKNNARKPVAHPSALDGLHLGNATASKTQDVRHTHHLEHTPHSIYQHVQPYAQAGFQPINRQIPRSGISPSALSQSTLSPSDLRQQYLVAPPTLPYYVTPLPPRIGLDEAIYLEKKGALTVPSLPLRNALLKAYIEFVHPFVPLLDLNDFVAIIDSGNGTLGRISLIVLQAVMFAGSAFCDMVHLRNAGYANRKDARKDFFQRTRLLYDFDYEKDRLALVQAISLLTYYYETPDDQKDTWHWMGVATAIAQTIGLHRNPERSNMGPKKIRLWKRVWWSLYMRDKLIALGMRRPTRVRPEDCNVPMLTMDDFEIAPMPETVACVPMDTLIARNVDHQRQMAVMCIEKAKLCVLISHVLSKHYCVLNNQQGVSNDRTTMMLLPKTCDLDPNELKSCDDELEDWLQHLPEDARYNPVLSGNPAIDVNKSLLHMIFMTTLSALHRPPVLPSEAPVAKSQSSNIPHELLEVSRRNVHRAASAITSVAQQLDSQNLVRYLPNTGVAVLLPAIIVHLLEIKSDDEEKRRNSLRGFCQCMSVMSKLRDIHAAADYSTAFLEAAIRKAGIQLAPAQEQYVNPAVMSVDSPEAEAKPQAVTSVEALVDAGRRMEMADSQSPASQQTPIASGSGPLTMTPPPDKGNKWTVKKAVTDEEVARRLETFLAATPPGSEHNDVNSCNSAILINGKGFDPAKQTSDVGMGLGAVGKDGVKDGATGQGNVTGLTLDLTNDVLFPMWQNMPSEFDENDFDSLMNLDAMGEAFSFEEGLEAAVKLQDQGLGATGLSVDSWLLDAGVK